MEKKRFSVTVCLLLLALTLAVTMPLAHAGTTSSGSIIIGNAAPTIAVSSIWNNGGGTNENNTVLTVWTEYWLNATISDTNSMLDESTVYFTIWDSGGITQGGADVNASHYTFLYTNSTNVWSEVGPGPSNAHPISGDCVYPSDKTQTTGVYRLAFKLDYVANYTYAAGNKSWKANINCTDSGANTATNSSIIFGVAFYNSVTVVDTTHSWSTSVATLPAVNATLDSPADHDVDVTVTANGVWTLQAEGSAAPNDGAGHTIPIGNILMAKGALGTSTNMTTGWVSVPGITSQTAGASLSTYIDLWVNVPSGQVAGTYTYTLTVQAIAVS